ncbi:hypothetical protein ABZ078_26570 [Streptomyces sp. NPDC006385]|uniref:hypothetical protein n=1 Tax=Streptomyces sp. NPDC006385 TaxID=3156761 RepID=UPI0033B4D35D
MECATHIARRLPDRARSNTTVPGMNAAQRDALLDVACGNVVVTQQYEQPGYGHTVTVDVEVLRHLEAQGLVTRKSASTPPFFPGGPPRDRVHLTALGICALSTVIDSSLHIHLPAVRPVPTTASTARARR